MKVVFPLSSNEEQIKKLKSSVPEGQWSKFVWDAVYEKLEKCELSKRRREWIEKEVTPKFKELSYGMSFGTLMMLLKNQEKRELFIKHLNDAEMPVTDEELIEMINKEASDDSRP